MNLKNKTFNIYDHNIFKYKKARESVLKSKNFIDFVSDLYPHIIDAHKIVKEIGWNDFQAELRKSIKESLLTFNVEAKAFGNKIPASGFKGIYFCLGDDCRSLAIGGSYYFNEEDWAANAEIYAEHPDDYEIVHRLSCELEGFAREEEESIIYLFVAYTLVHLLMEGCNIPFLINTGIAIGYSDGDEVILGNFENSKFIPGIKLIKDGNYKTPSSAPKIETMRTNTGPLWEYLRHNYSQFLREHNLYHKLEEGGEEEAEKMAKKYKNDLFINKCRKCSFIKMTPSARQCLNCMDFCDPVYTRVSVFDKIKNLFFKK